MVGSLRPFAVPALVPSGLRCEKVDQLGAGMTEWTWDLKVDWVAGLEPALEVYSTANGWDPVTIIDAGHDLSFMASAPAATFLAWRIMSIPTKVTYGGGSIAVPQTGQVLQV